VSSSTFSVDLILLNACLPFVLAAKRAHCEHMVLTRPLSFVGSLVELLKDVGSGRISVPGLCGSMGGCHLFSCTLVCRLVIWSFTVTFENNLE